LIDSDITEEHPVAGTFVKRAVNKGSALIVVDTRSTKIARFATRHLVITPGAESVLVNGLINGLVERGRKCSEELRETAAGFPLDRVSETAGVSVDDLRAVLDLLDAEGPVALVYGSRAASSAPGFLALQELLGNLDRACGGVNYLGDLNNSQGACDMGLLPGHLPGYAPVQWDEVRKHFETAWGCSLNPTPGLGFEEILRNLDQPAQGSQKSIRFLYCVGENLAVAGASVCDIRAALDAVEFLVVQDNLDNETVPFADVVLPAAAWGEDEGTYTNCERRVSRVRRAVSAPEEAKPETWIFTQLARRLGQDWPEMTSLEIWDTEISQLAPQLKGITYQLMETEGVQWSLPAETPGEDPRALTLGAPLIFGKWVPFTYHHRGLLEQCEGLLESLPSAGGIGTHVPPSDPKGVTEKFLQLLESEEKGHAKEQIDDILNTYRTRRGGLIPVLQQVQEILGFLPIPVQNYIAMGLGIPASDVFGVVTFYSFFTMVPRGRHIIRICLGTACFVKGSGKLLDTLQRHLRVDVGQTTEDREYSLEVVRCIGACGLAPVMVVDEVTHGQVQPNEIVGIVESYRGPE
jgi:NADH:ubiquinone oxidoreductase subunit E